VLSEVDAVNLRMVGMERERVQFELLTSVDSRTRLTLETTRENLCCRIIDLIAPVGLGQRGVIAGPAASGKCLVLENIANAITVNHPEVVLLSLLIDQHPEDVAAMRRSLKGSVVYTTAEEPAVRHVHLAELVIERARRLVESKHDVVVLLDSLTSLASAYQHLMPPRLLADDMALTCSEKAVRLFEAARCCKEGGSLTILATVETGAASSQAGFLEQILSVTDLQIFLDREVLDQGLFPSGNIHLSRNQHAEHLLAKEDLSRIWVLRKVLEPLSPSEALRLLGGKLLATRSNSQFLSNMSSI